MKQSIENLIAASPYKVHVSIQPYDTKEIIYEHLAEDIFSSASVIKVPILVAILAYLQKTNGDLQQNIEIDERNFVDFSVLTEQHQKTASLHELLLWMIMTSDNTATNECIDFLGMEMLNTYFQKIGLKDTKLQRKMMDFERQRQGFDNVTTARDMQILFQALFEQKLLNAEWTEVAFTILCRQRSQESLKRYLVDDVKMAHKTGGLDTVDHDCGIVFANTKTYFIGVFVTEVTNNEFAKQLIGKIAKEAYIALS